MPGPSPKPRPALVLAVGEVDGKTHVEVAFGTSQRTDRLYSGEFRISPDDGEAYVLSGLGYPTKFDLRNRREGIEFPEDTLADLKRIAKETGLETELPL